MVYFHSLSVLRRNVSLPCFCQLGFQTLSISDAVAYSHLSHHSSLPHVGEKFPFPGIHSANHFQLSWDNKPMCSSIHIKLPVKCKLPLCLQNECSTLPFPERKKICSMTCVSSKMWALFKPLSVSWDFEAVTPSRSGEMRAETYNPPSSLMMLACIFQPKPGLRVKAWCKADIINSNSENYYHPSWSADQKSAKTTSP